MRRGIPYRGQPERKIPHGHPLPPAPNEKWRERALWFIASIIGIVIAYFAIIDKTGIAAFILFVYLMFLVVIFFASRDAQNSQQVTPGLDDQKKESGRNGSSSLAADYFDQLEWNHSHHRSMLSSRGGSREPEWRYQPVQAHSKTAGAGCLSWLAVYTIPFVVLSVIVYVSLTFGVNSPITLGILFVFGMIGVGIVIVAQELKDGPGIVLRKHRPKELGHKMSKHGRK